MKVTMRQIRRIIKEIRSEMVPPQDRTGPQAHQRGDLGKNIADADFPIVVGYKLNGQDQSEIAYNQDELDDILDDVAPVTGGTGIPYSLDSLADMEPSDIPVGADIEQIAAGKIMKITKRQLTKLIRESMAADDYVELTDVGDYDDASVSRNWPEKVFWNGNSVYEMIYGGNTVEDAWGYLEREGYGDGQEVYLGYDPQSDTFVMGFDAFFDDVDEYGNSDPGGPMEGVIVELGTSASGDVQFENIVEQTPDGMYPMGLKVVKKLFPGIIDIRLD